MCHHQDPAAQPQVQQLHFLTHSDFCRYADDLVGQAVGFKTIIPIKGENDFMGQVIGIYNDGKGKDFLVLHDRAIPVYDIDIQHISISSNVDLLGPIDPKEDLMTQAKTGPKEELPSRLAALVKDKFGLLPANAHVQKSLPAVDIIEPEELEDFLARMKPGDKAEITTHAGDKIKFKSGILNTARDTIILTTDSGNRGIALKDIYDFVILA